MVAFRVWLSAYKSVEYMFTRLSNVTDMRTDRQTEGRTPHDGIGRAMHIVARQKAHQALSQPSGNGGSFSSDFGPFQGLKVGVSSGCLGETSIFGRPLGQAIATGNPSVCNVGVLWPNGLSDRDDFWHTPCPGQQ